MTKNELTDDLVVEALFAGAGILSDAARCLAVRLGRRVSRQELADRVEASRVLRAVQQIAHQRAFDQSVANCRRALREKRSEAMRASWARRRGRPEVTILQNSPTPPTRARARARHGVMFGRPPISG